VSTRQRGDRYELEAREHLERLGYEIIATNFRVGHKEIDIICRDKEELVFVEVKGGQADDFGDPVHKVNSKKQQAIIKVAQGFLAGVTRKYESYRFDVIVVRDQQKLEIEHIRAAFTL
jgi:putative endonuclease